MFLTPQVPGGQGVAGSNPVSPTGKGPFTQVDGPFFIALNAADPGACHIHDTRPGSPLMPHPARPTASSVAGRARPVWWTEFIGPDWSEALAYHLDLESEATRIDSWTIDLVPGLLQTRDYSAALMTSRVDVPSEQLERRLALRERRQERVQNGSLELWAILSEAVLYGQIGGPDVLRGQLEYLAGPPGNVTVQILPFTAGAHSGLGTSFHLLAFAGWPTVGYQDTIQQGLYYDDPDVVNGLTRTIDDVRATALSPSASREMIARRATELKGE
ncbi:hypothetical protein LY12_001272 [Prauserella alba]|uniref:DUF5753 domain-containing protein n=2 Tax=Prauserella alba TaxID=176898 RepID=A0ABP4G2Q0_9PSEU|nr:hypothetical protein [Prauserella alba]